MQATAVVVAMATAARAATYVGAGACAASNCHGSATARIDGAHALQNEYLVWFKQDRHAHAYTALAGPLGVAIGRRLGLVPDGDAAGWIARTPAASKCLGCHALDVPTDARGPRFDVADGVSCEACHGPAGDWLASHARRGATVEQAVAAGMVDTRDPLRVAATCLDCHLGGPTTRVDHAMLAAGHPPLGFELDTFATNMPAHWIARDDARAWFDGRAWAVGQAVMLREAARDLTRRVPGAGWPDFAAYDCDACHHDLGAASRWRQDRTDGHPAWDRSRYAVALRLARVAAPDVAGRLEPAVARVAAAAAACTTTDLAPAADAVASAADALALQIARAPISPPLRDRIIDLLLADAAPLASGGFRVAQQLAWSLDALGAARGDAADAPFRAGVGRLFDRLATPAGYDPAGFAHAVAAIHAR